MTNKEIKEAIKKFKKNRIVFILSGRSNGKKYVLEQLEHKKLLGDKK